MTNTLNSLFKKSVNHCHIFLSKTEQWQVLLPALPPPGWCFYKRKPKLGLKVQINVCDICCCSATGLAPSYTTTVITRGPTWFSASSHIYSSNSTPLATSEKADTSCLSQSGNVQAFIPFSVLKGKNVTFGQTFGKVLW